MQRLSLKKTLLLLSLLSLRLVSYNIKIFVVSYIAILILGGCATTPPDSAICYELDLTRGYCVHIISGKAYEVNDKVKLYGMTWWQLRPSNIALPAQSWKEIKAYIIKSCAKYKNCDKEVSSWERTLNNFDSKVGR